MLVELPNEILGLIVADFTGTRDFRSLSLTCKRLHLFIEAEGWQLFLGRHFPSVEYRGHWRDAAHALTTLSRNWRRRAFLATPIQPATRIHTLPSVGTRERWNKRPGQTMGYQPVIDSYEEETGKSWASRKEVVVWGAGAEVVVRTLVRGNKVFQEWRHSSANEEYKHYDTAHCKFEWISHQDARHVDGRDDITSMRILRPGQRQLQGGASGGEEVVVGRASGELTLLSLCKGVPKCTLRNYDTRKRQIRSADVSSDPIPLLATCVGDGGLVLFNVHAEQHRVEPVNEVQVVAADEKHVVTWSTRFLSRDRIAVGRGVSDKIVHIYDVRPSGLGQVPYRTFGCGKASNVKTTTSAYPIVPVDSQGQVFFSGGFDGRLRLHDMRSPSDIEAIFADDTDESAIFSLMMIGMDRVVVGAAANSLLKVFELRMSKGKAYSYLDANGDVALIGPKRRGRGDMCSRGWNIFTGNHHQGQADRRGASAARNRESPIYSLSRPSSSSPFFYVGRENQVVQFNMTSMTDKHPDPLFKHSMCRMKNGELYVKRTWDPDDRVLNLSMYDQTLGGDFALRTQLRVGGSIGQHLNTVPGLDERWY